jgi:hypothetical protein
MEPTPSRRVIEIDVWERNVVTTTVRCLDVGTTIQLLAAWADPNSRAERIVCGMSPATSRGLPANVPREDWGVFTIEHMPPTMSVLSFRLHTPSTPSTSGFTPPPQTCEVIVQCAARRGGSAWRAGGRGSRVRGAAGGGSRVLHLACPALPWSAVRHVVA